MRRKTLRFMIEVLIALALVVVAYTFYRAFYYAPNDEVPLADSIPLEATVGQSITAKPLKLSIPKIGIDADVQHVGITQKGNMAAPNNFVDVGWYKFGTIPGNRGSAIIAGHVNNGVALPAVFANLKDLREGDEIFVTNEDGERLRFVVSGTEVYDFNANAEEVFADDSGKLLKLITCTGVFVQQYRTHNKRMVITAKLAEQGI